MKGVLAESRESQYIIGMTRIFDMDDHARMPWRFHADCVMLAVRE
ncbi:MAG TPA: hypothetical protein VLA51_12415 [Paracoccaceae bacterium]|nr:hypothetical protein [Paracoccaceae bacterium]